MSLYTPQTFHVTERAAIARLLHDHSFATLVTPAQGEMHVSHLPLLFVPGCEPHGVLIGHMARANPHWQAATTVASTAIFQGPHAYVTPSWYEHPDRMVPTWNYAVVHCHGTLELIEDPAETRRVLDIMIHRFEHARAVPWKMGLTTRQRDDMVGAIVSFRMRIKRLGAKFKLSQNRSSEDRRRVANGLRGEDHADARATATWMDAYAPPEEADNETR